MKRRNGRGCTWEDCTKRSQYEISLQYRPEYAYALAGMGRIAVASGELDKAIANFTRANSQLDEHAFKEELAEVYELSGNKDKADSILQWLITAMIDEAKKEKRNGELAHNEDGEFAILYVKAGAMDKAIDFALADYNRRPANIQVNEMLAWVYYNIKEYVQNYAGEMETKRKAQVKAQAKAAAATAQGVHQ